MSFNLRYAEANDGENSWDYRSDLVVETIRRYEPDLLGTQEMLARQGEFLDERLPGHTRVGVGRADGATGGEFTGILFKTDRFEMVDQGTIWLSPTPSAPSVGWDAELPRIMTWVKLRDRQENAAPLAFLNTHWDHVGARARVESARLIHRWLAENAPDYPVIITGDFNCDVDSEPYHALVDDRPDGVHLIDPHRQLRPELTGVAGGTFHGFTGKVVLCGRIDWILCSRNFAPLSAEIERINYGGRYPSDHFPITATLKRN
jgi:endonuclease/exonuclease/phosphatase family metal-dependent hydrolase